MHSLEIGMKRRIILAAMIAMAASPMVSQERTSAIAGSVQDDFGTAVSDAQIKLKSNDGSGVEVQAVSTADGQFSFKDVRPGSYMLAGVARQGKLMGSLSKVVLTPGNTLTVVLSLKAAQQNEKVLGVRPVGRP